jgi:uncharacterized protein (TIGR02996 family)
MSDEEALLRRVVDAPGDEAPRLVYADWLDERGDPRATFLRQELEVFRGPREGPSFRAGVRDLQLARRTLEPVWAARLSRPPVGVCGDVFHGSTTPGPPVDLADIQAYEARAQLVLPVDYKAFLLNQNGGDPYPGEFVHPDAGPDELPVRLEGFSGIDPRTGPTGDGRGPYTLNQTYDHPFDRGRRLLPINGDGSDGCLFLEVAGPYVGWVTYHDDFTHNNYDTERYVRVAESFARFLACLITTDPDWAQLVVRADEAGLRAWLDAGGDPNAVHEENEFTPLMYAIDWQRVGMVRELLSRGARVTRQMRYQSGYQLNREIAGLIDAALRGPR